MYSTDELFKMDAGAFADVLTEIRINLGKEKIHDKNSREFTEQELRLAFSVLPETTRNIAHSWSLGDTVFRDEAHEWFMKHGLPKELSDVSPST